MKLIDSDKTEYARAYGYTGKRKVIVSDGKVVSHNNADWFEFMQNVRRKHREKA